jgi:hypothetical protein
MGTARPGRRAPPFATMAVVGRVPRRKGSRPTARLRADGSRPELEHAVRLYGPEKAFRQDPAAGEIELQQ